MLTNRTVRATRTTRTAVRGITLLSVVLAASFVAPWPALAGPNGGGTLIVHDSGLGYTSASALYPSPPPNDCASTDNEMPTQIAPGSEGRVWKVYAAFMPGSSPRLKALAFGESFDSGLVVVLSGGLPDPVYDLEITLNGWPSADGGGVGISFGATQTATINEVYWFGGYARDEAPGLWSTMPHPVQASIFVDDSFPGQADPIVGFSSIGFGMPGTTVCPLPERACCFADGVCQVLSPAACDAAGGTFDLSAVCAPNPCPQTGACCFLDESCQVLDASACAQMGGLSQGYGTDCDPNPCPSAGACCLASGACVIREAELCAQAGGWHQGYGTDCSPDPCVGLTAACCFSDGHCLTWSWEDCAHIGGTGLPGVESCLPNPCPQLLGRCCYPDGSCQMTLHVDCTTGHWAYWGQCDPNPCPQLGACCRRNGTCDISLPAECADAWIHGSCDPNPCLTLEGACCLADGSCAIRLLVECELEFVPLATCNPESIPCPNLVGACCFQDGSCRLLARWECEAAGGAPSGDSCDTSICPMPTPVERTSWGRIKAAFR